MQIFNRTPPRIKPKSLRIDRNHRMALGLVNAWFLAEGGGTTAYDLAGTDNGTLTNTPVWAAGRYGGGLDFASGSSQYVDCGDVSNFDGASALTCVMWGKRLSAAADRVACQKGSSATSRVAFGWSSSLVFGAISNGSDAFGNLAETSLAAQMMVMVFDGSQSTNATRLRLWLNAVEQTGLSFTGTIPATTPSNAATFRIGAQQSLATFTNGRIDQVLIYNRVLSEREIYRLYRQPLCMTRNTRQYWPVNSIPWTAYYSNLSPANLSTHQPHDGAVSIDWTPTDNGGNPITGTPTITGNGFTCDVTTSSLGGGALRCTAVIPAYARRTNTVTSTCTTTDSRVNSVTWTYTSSRAAISSDYFTDYIVPRIGSTDENVDFAVPRTGTLAATTETVEYAVQDAAAGVLNSVDNLTDYYAVDQVYAPLAPIGADIGTFGQNQIPIGVNVNATDHAILAPIGANVSGRDHTILAPIGADIAEQFYGPMAPIGVNVGTFGQSAIPIGAVISRALAEMHVELFFASEALQEIEDEP